MTTLQNTVTVWGAIAYMAIMVFGMYWYESFGSYWFVLTVISWFVMIPLWFVMMWGCSKFETHGELP